MVSLISLVRETLKPLSVKVGENEKMSGRYNLDDQAEMYLTENAVKLMKIMLRLDAKSVCFREAKSGRQSPLKNSCQPPIISDVKQPDKIIISLSG